MTVVSGTNFLCAASALLLCGPLCGFARVQDWTLSYQAPVPRQGIGHAARRLLPPIATSQQRFGFRLSQAAPVVAGVRPRRP